MNLSQPTLGTLELNLILKCFQNNQLSMGPMVHDFEAMFGKYLKVQEVITTTSGTTALHLALAALGIGPGDEVLIPDMTFVATANAVSYVGATPVLVDIDPLTWTIDIWDMENKATTKTKAVIPVHLYGMPCDMTTLLIKARNYGWKVIEDAAEGLGGSWGHQKLGTLGDIGCFSFYGNKIISTGEGGACVTHDAESAKRLRFLRGQGQTTRYFHTEVGFNYRMTDVQAALGIGQLSRIEDMLHHRRLVYQVYHEELADLVGEPTDLPPGAEAAPWLYTALVNKRDCVMSKLAKRNIETRPTFVPMHRLPMYRSTKSFPNSDLVGDMGISLPTHSSMTQEDAAEVAEALREALR